MLIAVLVSGRGSNLQALIDASQKSGFPAKIACVISNNPGVGGLDRAAKAGIPTHVVNHRDYKNREAFEEALNAILTEKKVQLVCLAGFMRLLTSWFVEHWQDRLINIHPSLLPAFPGVHVHKQALDYGVKFSGCTVHFVRAEMDKGPIIIQAAVPVYTQDTEDTLAARVLETEHIVYPEAVRLIAEGRVNVHEEKVFIAEAKPPEGAFINPLPV